MTTATEPHVGSYESVLDVTIGTIADHTQIAPETIAGYSSIAEADVAPNELKLFLLDQIAQKLKLALSPQDRQSLGNPRQTVQALASGFHQILIEKTQ